MEQNNGRSEFGDKIKSLNRAEIDEILFGIISRHSALFPESELVCLFLPKNDMEERKRILTQSVEFLLNHPGEDEK